MNSNNQELSSKFYPLPCFFTIASLFCGFYSIISSIKGNFTIAAIAILVAAVFDGLDGRVARMTGTTSKFGMELDSLCDLISFGAAPGLLAYLWALQPYGRYGWLAAFLYVATTALRLARFNSQDAETSKDFIGLPCPSAAAMIVTTVLFSHFLGFTDTINHISILFLVYILSYLMVSTHRYLSFKHKVSSRKRTFQVLVGSLLLFILVAAEPQVMLFSLTLIYTASGPFMGLYEKLRKIGKVSESKQCPKTNKK